jgi:hypothetical protein
MFCHVEDIKRKKMQEVLEPDNDGLRKGGQQQFDQLPIINFVNA